MVPLIALGAIIQPICCAEGSTYASGDRLHSIIARARILLASLSPQGRSCGQVVPSVALAAVLGTIILTKCRTISSTCFSDRGCAVIASALVGSAAAVSIWIDETHVCVAE